MIRYRFDYENANVVAVECADRGYPYPDNDGFKQYDSTHFDAESDAWAKLLRECEAAITIAARNRVELRETLERVTKDLADNAERLVAVKRNRDASLGVQP